MGSFRTTVKTLELGTWGSPTETGRAWDAPCGMPIHNTYIYLSSRGAPVSALGITWAVYLGGVWSGEPYGNDSTHTGGILLSTANIVGASEYAHQIYGDTTVLPTSLKSFRPTGSGTNIGQGSMPLVCTVSNLSKLSALTIHVTFVNKTLSELS